MITDVLAYLKQRKSGVSFQKLAAEWHLSAREKVALKKELRKMESQGLVLRLRRKYFYNPRSNLIRGKVVTVLKGYAFVTPEKNAGEDIFIPARYLGDALRGDIVEVLSKDQGRKSKPEGRVIRILEKGKKSFLALYRERFGKPFALPFDSPASEEIPLKETNEFSLSAGMVVEVHRETRQVIEILGMPDEPGVDAKVVIHRFGLEDAFPREALEEAEAIPLEIDPQDREGREDYRDWPSVTIDGADAQDFDDAVSIRSLENGHFLLGVHIADVSAYVRPGSPLDKAAYRRGTSVYFPGLTLPMLPEKLSNFVCSLRPREEKLVFSVILEIDREGSVVQMHFHPSLICTAERMTYDSVFKIFEGNPEERTRFSPLVPSLLLMRDLARLLRARRIAAGSLDFDLTEAELVYKEGNLHSVVPLERNEAHQLIEEFMVAANEAVATFLFQQKFPVLFRVHPPPSRQNLDRLRDILTHFGIYLPASQKLTSKDLQSALEQVKGRPEEKFVSLLVLKSLKLASYSEKKEGHYGLAKELYAHFTSPIRRYPDLIVHRLLKCFLQKRPAPARSLSAAALHCSEQERKADEAERDLLEWRIFRFLRNKVGEVLGGVIVDFTKAGLAVELDSYFVDGMVSYADLSGDYFFRKNAGTLTGKRTGQTFELGDRVCVVLAAVDPWKRRITLTFPPGKGGHLEDS